MPSTAIVHSQPVKTPSRARVRENTLAVLVQQSNGTTVLKALARVLSKSSNSFDRSAADVITGLVEGL